MIANTAPARPLFFATLHNMLRSFHWLAAATVVLSLTGCGTGGSQRPAASDPASIGGVALPDAAQDYNDLDMVLINRIKQTALLEGSLAASSLYMTLSLEQPVDPGTAAIIDSHLAWLEGRLAEADTQLDTAAALLGPDHPVVINERIRRRAVTGQWLQASQLIYHHRVRGQSMPNPDSSVLWASLLHVDDQALRRASTSPGDTEWREWLELNLAYRAGKAAVSMWFEKHPGHPAASDPPANLRAWLTAPQPQRIAVLLPLSGRLEAAGKAVYEGVLEAFFEAYPDPRNRPQLFAVDTEGYADTLTAYRDAEARQADIVIGPLTKTDAALLRDTPTRSLPIIALNRPESTTERRPSNWISLSLAPEDEARQLAQIAFGNGQRRALIIQPSSDWGGRMEAALSQRWRELGGTLVEKLILQAEPSESEQISEAVGAFESEARIKAFEDAFDAPVEARPRRRQDFDVVFLLAPDAAIARRLRPLLVYHYAADVPVYASSAVANNDNGSQNRDLNELVVLEIPALSSGAKISQGYRLKALGKDAVQLVDHWSQLSSIDSTFLRADTGILSVTQSGNIERELIPAIFEGGSLKPLALP